MKERTIDNQLRHGKRHFELVPTRPAALGSGALFEEVTLGEEVGPEVVLMLVDLTPFAHELKQLKPLSLRLKGGVAPTSSGPILFLLWWIPPITNGKPFALYEQILNPTNERTLEGLRRVARQTHLHLILVGAGQELLDVYEFENTFELDKLVSGAERACNDYGSLDFNAAKQDYDETYDLMELFASDATEAEMPAEPEDKLPTERSSCRPVQSPPSGRTLLQPDTTFHWSPNTGDFLLWIRCANPLCNPPEFAIADFWEFREGDHLLITNREEDYPAPVEQMEEGGPALWKVLPGDRLTWVGWRWSAAESKPTLIALIDCSHEGYVYGEPAYPTLESVMSFGTHTTEATPDARSLWMVGYNAVMALGVPRTWCPLE
jgi:hypothetical protein